MLYADIYRDFQSASFGGKAHGLWELRSIGARIPASFCISLTGPISDFENDQGFRRALSSWIGVAGNNPRWIIRSSAFDEDSYSTSGAGLNPSHIVKVEHPCAVEALLLAATRAVLSRLLLERNRAGVVLQPFLQGDLSGVVFSTDPNEGLRGKGSITYAEGTCLGVVAGMVGTSATTFSLCSNQEAVPSVLRTFWNELTRHTLLLESKWNVPVDIEFTVCGGNLYFLQARPVASISVWRGREGIGAVGEDTVSLHPKIELRKRCLKSGASISKAWLATESVWQAFSAPPLPPGCYSSVLIRPTRLDGKIRRAFSSDGLSAASSLLNEAEIYWVRHALIMEIIDGRITGIAQRKYGEAVIELARGHFVPKGVLETAVFTLSEGGAKPIQLPIQKRYFEIDCQTGAPVSKPCGQRVSVTEEQLASVWDLVTRLDLSPTEVLEFGLDASGHAYAIDIEVGPACALAGSSQVLSPGIAEGELVVVADAADDVDVHFGNRADLSGSEGSPVIIAAEKPKLTLLSHALWLRKCGKRVVGFVFVFYSPLCHLAILLREWGVPAMVSNPGILQWPSGERIRISALDPEPTVERLDSSLPR